jgi:hypothetical protein
MYLVEYLVLQTVIHQLMVNSQNLPPTRGTFLPPARAKNVHARIGYTEDSLTIRVNSTHPSKSHYLTKVLTNSSTLPFKNEAHAPPSSISMCSQLHCRQKFISSFKAFLSLWRYSLSSFGNFLCAQPITLTTSNHVGAHTIRSHFGIKSGARCT